MNRVLRLVKGGKASIHAVRGKRDTCPASRGCCEPELASRTWDGIWLTISLA